MFFLMIYGARKIVFFSLDRLFYWKYIFFITLETLATFFILNYNNEYVKNKNKYKLKKKSYKRLMKCGRRHLIMWKNLNDNERLKWQ